MQGRENKSINCNIFVWKSERNRPFGRNICTPIKEDNIRIDVREIGCSGVEWIHLAQDANQWRVFVINLRVVKSAVIL
jgi:hypothetical protein